jgi:dihydroorotate dehydrogenase electron transfer subunit
MLNLVGERELVFGRPFSLLAAEGPLVSILYRAVGRGTGLLAQMRRGDRLSFLGPLGRPFPAPRPRRRYVLLAGGVGLPPLHAWWRRYRRPDDRAFFGSRDGGDVPWPLLTDGWDVSIDVEGGLAPGRQAFVGLVTELARARLGESAFPSAPDGSFSLLVCGPLPLLRAAAGWAREEGWECLVSVEEQMGCGYGVCKGCVVPLRDPTAPPAGPNEPRPFRPATSCDVGPVFAAEEIDWEQFARSGATPGGTA